MNALELMYVFNLHNKLGDISMWAYQQDCYGLTEEECRTLESLCDKAREGIEKEVGTVFTIKPNYD